MPTLPFSKEALSKILLANLLTTPLNKLSTKVTMMLANVDSSSDIF